MDFTVEMGKLFNLSPFDILHQDKDEVIMLINYFIEKGEGSKVTQKKTANKNGKTVERIRVNDKTASGGWW